jgi:poly(glycerol-phosphate) alpha-glucosyltransferase
MAIEVIEKISERHDVIYHIYGDGPQRNNLIELVDTKKLNSVIVFKGFVDEPQELAKDYDFYLSSSKFEGFGLSIVDGLRGGNVVIMTPVGELRNYITDGVDGIFIGFDPKESTSTIENVFEMDNDKLNIIQKNGRDLYKKNFTETIFLNRIDRIYRRTLN